MILEMFIGLVVPAVRQELQSVLIDLKNLNRVSRHGVVHFAADVPKRAFDGHDVVRVVDCIGGLCGTGFERYQLSSIG